MRVKNVSYKLMEAMLLLTILFMPMEMSMDLTIYSFITPYKVFLLALYLVTLYKLRDKSFRNDFISSNIEQVKKYKILVIILLLYYGFDLLSVLWTADKFFSLKKYVTVVPIATLVPYIFYYFRPGIQDYEKDENLMKLFTTMGAVAVILSVIAWVLYLIFGSTYYQLRMSLQSDYNQFVTSILLGYLCGLVPIARFSSRRKYLLYVVYSAIIMPIMFTAGSRRTTIALPLVVIVSVIPFIYYESRKRKNFGKALIRPLVSLFAIGISMFLLVEGYTYDSHRSYLEKERVARQSGVRLVSAAMDNSAGIIHDFRLERSLSEVSGTLADGEAASARSILWDVALTEISRFSPKEILIGKGGSFQKEVYQGDYALEVYKRNDIREIPKYQHPHSMIFLEMLNGGAIKLALTLSFVLTLVIYCFRIIRSDFGVGVILLAYGALFLAGQIIDSYYGITQNRLTWIYMFLMIGSYSLFYKKKIVKKAP